MACLPRGALAAACFLTALALAPPCRAALQELTEAERSWLAAHPVVRVGVDRVGAPPLDVPGSDGGYYGISAELLRRIAYRLDLRLEIRTYADRGAVVAAARRGEVDVVPSMQRSADGARQFLFTSHYLYGHSVLLKHPGFAEGDLPRIAIVRGRQPADALAARIPKHRVVEVPDALAGFAAVSEGRAEAYAGLWLPLAYALGDAAGRMEQLREEALDAGELRFAVRQELALLASALDKGLGSFTPAEIDQIARTWNVGDGVRKRTPTLVLREDERRYLERLGTLRVAWDADFEPFTFLQGGEPAGMSVDYLRAAADRLGVRVQFLGGETFGRALDAVVEGNAEVLAAAARTPERRRYLRFAGPTFSQPTALITRLDTEHVTGLGDLEARAVALPHGYFLRERLAREFPAIQVVACRDSEDCLREVVEGRAVATLGNLAVISTLIERRFPGRLRVAGTVFDAPSELYLAFGERHPQLQSAFQRALDSLSPDQHDRIRARWRTASYQEGVSIADVLKVALPVGGAALLLLSFILFTNRRLAREVDRRRAAEEELRMARDRAETATQAKSAFLAVMSHEIRTPMNGVLGVLDVLRHTRLTPDQQGLVKTAGASARSLLALLNDLLDFSKIEAGKMRLAPAPARLRAVAEAAVNLFAMQAFEKGVTLGLRIDPALAESHRFDDVRVGQVLANLVSNAVKFTDAGEVSVEVEARDEGDEAQRVVIRVRDSGIGIDPTDQARLFTPFEQAQGTSTRRREGTGLGLAICRHIAELMGAELTLESERGKGSTFTFSALLPVVAREAQAPASPGPATPQRAARILVVEDHPVNQLVVRRQLELLGHSVEIAADGVQGLEKWRTGHFDLLLVDRHMPLMEGEEMLRRLREEESARGTRRTPALGLSADGHEPMAGVDATLAKPVLAEALERALAQWLPHDRPGPIDEAGLREALGDEEGVRATLEALRGALAQDLDRLKGALRDREMAEARRGAHRILGAARTVGAERLAHAAAAMQDAAGSSDFAAAAAAYGELERARDEVVAAIEAKMGASPPAPR